MLSYLPATILIILLVNNLYAIPAFARKYDKSCQTCHVSEPKLNEFGERFRANGYQLPGTIEDNPPWTWPQFMMAGMLHEMAVDREIVSNMDATPPPGLPPNGTYDVRSFRNAGGHLWFGGTFGKNLSFLSSLGIDQELEVENGRFSSPTHAHWEFAFFQYNNLFNSGVGNANLKFGSFELELPFSNIRRLSSALSPYEVYNIRGVKGSFALSEPQVGVSLNGIKYLGFNTFRYEAAMVNGTNAHFDTNVEFDYYGRIAISRLFDNFAWLLQRGQIGGLYYQGEQNLKDLPGNPYPTDSMLDYWKEEYGENFNVHVDAENSKFYRAGFDFSVDLKLPAFEIGALNLPLIRSIPLIKKFPVLGGTSLPLDFAVNIYGQYLEGHDDDIDMTDEHMPFLGSESSSGDGGHRVVAGLGVDPKWGTRPGDFSGGFVGADIVMVPTKLYFITRYDWVNVMNQWADPVNGQFVREPVSYVYETVWDEDINDFVDKSVTRGDDMPYGMTDAQTEYSRYIVGFRWHLIQPITLIYEYGSQDNLFGFPEPTPFMYNDNWVAGMGRTVNVDSDWHMFMVMFAF